MAQEEVGAAEVAGVALAVVLGVEEVVEEATEGVSEGAVVVGVSEVVQGVVDEDAAASEGTLQAQVITILCCQTLLPELLPKRGDVN